MIIRKVETKILFSSTCLLLMLTYFFSPLVYGSEIIIAGNGESSSNEVNVVSEDKIEVTQENNSKVSNNVSVLANSGKNSASNNTGENVEITTGEVKVEVDVENEINNSYIQTECCAQKFSAEVLGNGTNSTNQIDLNRSSTIDISITQNAQMTNNILGSINTGVNLANGNTNGNVIIDTGDIKVTGSLVNDPINTSDTEVTLGTGRFSGEISGNGSDSSNKITSNFVKTVSVYSDFNSNLVNNVAWDLNTGRNSANENSGGDVIIRTGDILFDFFISNFMNIGGIEVKCCPLEEEKEEEEQDEEEEGEPPVGGVPSEKEEEKDGNDGQGQILPEAAAVEAGGPGVDGLAVTSGSSLQSLLFFIGICAIAFGGKIATDELFAKTSRKKR